MNAVTAREILAQNRREPASQATRVEQSRAVAEVQAAFTVAAARPRDASKALADILESCRMRSVAENAFFKFPRGGQSVQGETIGLAVEMARCWGNISYSVMELDRDDIDGKSEMLATATDLETNTSSRTSFIVPHKRDKEGNKPAVPLTSMRDIYENNANMGARRLRECIFRVLPTWLIDAAREECYRTLENREDQRPLPVRLAAMVSAFSEIGVSQDRIEAKLGPVAKMTTLDLASLGISFKSIQRREILPDEEFPRVATEDVASAARRIAEASKAQRNDGTLAADNPDAGEGRGDEDMGEAHAEDGLSPSQSKARDLIARAQAAANLIDLETVESEADSHLSFMDDDTAAQVRAAFDAASRRINSKGTK